MLIDINLDEKYFSPSLEDLISDKLKSAGLPECLGSMTPIIISKTAEVNADNILKHVKSVPKDNIVVEYKESVIIKDMVIDKNGVENVKKYKEDITDKYVTKLVKCVICNHIDICDKLTTHYINTLSILEKEK